MAMTTKTTKDKTMKQCDIDLINFLKVNKGWQWYGNDRATKKVVNRLVRRNICVCKKQVLDNLYTHRQVKLINNN